MKKEKVKKPKEKKQKDVILKTITYFFDDMCINTFIVSKGVKGR